MRSLAPGIVAALIAAGLSGAAHAQKYVAVTAIIEHPALNAVRDGLKKGLADLGYAEDSDVVYAYETAHGNPATAAQIARQLVSDQPDVIVAISTPSAQAVAAASDKIPLVFSAVTDPYGAGLVQSATSPGGNITGVSDKAPVGDQLALIREIAPHLDRLGVLYNPSEANSVSSVALLRQVARAMEVEVVEGTVTKPADVQAATRSLAGRVDAIYIPTDNTIVPVLEEAVGAAEEAGLPLFASDTTTVARGVLAAIGFDYFDLGIETAALVDQVLKGKTPGSIPVVFASGTDLHVNKAVAETLGMTLPQNVLDRASKIIE